MVGRLFSQIISSDIAIWYYSVIHLAYDECSQRVYNDLTSIEPAYPSVLPSVGDSPAYDEYISRHVQKEDGQGQGDPEKRVDSPMAGDDENVKPDLHLLHAPPG